MRTKLHFKHLLNKKQLSKEVITVKEYKQIIVAVIIAIALVVSALILSDAIMSAGANIGSQIASAICQIK